jgi:hypothetical protein
VFIEFGQLTHTLVGSVTGTCLDIYKNNINSMSSGFWTMLCRILKFFHFAEHCSCHPLGGRGERGLATAAWILQWVVKA